MTVRVLGLASGQTTAEAHRLVVTGFTHSAGILTGRTGMYPAPNAGNLTTVSAMVAAIAPFNAWIDGTNTSTQAGYSFCSDAAVNVTFDAGNASTIRTDRVIARVRDNPYDGSGSQAGSVEILKGNTTTGAATAMPANSYLMFEIAVPVGASAGGGGINFNTQTTDKRVYTAGSGGIFPVASATDEAAISSPGRGDVIYRTDVDYLKAYNGSAWKPVGRQIFANAAARDAVLTSPVLGDRAFLSDIKVETIYSGTKWLYAPGEIIARYRRTTNSSTTTSEVGVCRVDGIVLKAGQVVKVRTSPLWFTSAAGDSVRAYVRYSTSGNATTSSSKLPGAGVGVTIGSISFDETKLIDALYVVPSDATYSLMLTIARGAGGAGAAGILSDSEKIIDLIVESVGIDPGSVGTSI